MFAVTYECLPVPENACQMLQTFAHLEMPTSVIKPLPPSGNTCQRHQIFVGICYAYYIIHGPTGI
jgi:hypothetical protein